VHARMTSRVVLSALLIFASGVYAVSAGMPQAQAATGSDGCSSTGSGGTSGGGGSDNDGVISVWASLSASSQEHLCPGTSSTGSSSSAQPLPACWWEPEFSPGQLAGAIEQYAPSSSEQTYTDYTGQYASTGINGGYSGGYSPTQGPKPPWERFNVGYDGTWWGLFYNEDATSGYSQCTTIFDNVYPENWFWVPNGDAAAPPNGPAMTDFDLAEYVAGKVKLAPVAVQSNPNLSAGTKTTVGLPTWLWADGGGNTTLDFEVCTQVGALCVDVAAQATGFSIVTGDSAATIYSDCKAGADGDIGRAYPNGDTGNPPCGITFRTPGTWPITLTTTWQVNITWTGGALPTLSPAPTTETDLNATVQAIQAVNY
jgi:hypothetical protein